MKKLFETVWHAIENHGKATSLYDSTLTLSSFKKEDSESKTVIYYGKLLEL